MIFGNWQITDDSIEWNGGGLHVFTVPKDGLNKIRQGKAGSPEMYEWILLATNEDWLTQDDLYDFNYAFVYAISKYDFDFNYKIFDATLEAQFEKLDAEDDEICY